MSRFEIKIVAALLLIAVIPLATSVVLVDQVIRVSESVAEGQLRRLADPLARAASAYRALFAARKRSFELRADLLARDPALLAATAARDWPRLEQRLEQLVRAERGLHSAAVEVDDGRRLLQRQRATTPTRATRDLRLERRLGSEDAVLRLTFFTAQQPFDDFQALGRAQRTAFEITNLRSELASYYRVVFLIIFGAVLLAATAGGIFIARRTTRKLTLLVRATREVAGGDLETRVAVRGKDELSELTASFNDMVAQLRESRERIGYLEKIGAWQDIARRLAHEIKNPLTPIQLAVQQLHQKYPGGDEAFGRLLDDARDIVSEEVEGLRRLVVAFSSFARLPSVRPEPVDLDGLIEDFVKSHVELIARARLEWQPVEGACRVLVDRMLIKHLLYNLVENAIQAAEEADLLQRLVVTLSARHEPSRPAVIELTVADNGPGIPGEVLKQVFDPYFTTRERGTGLGLAIVKKIVLEHGGAISVRSRPGQGSCFVLTLPLVVAELRQESAIRTTISRLLGGAAAQRQQKAQHPGDGESLGARARSTPEEAQVDD